MAMTKRKKIAVIGAGFSGLSAAAYLANAGFEVDVFEQHAAPGGRARQFSEAGYIFDTGPSWYWMPDVFDRFFEDLGSVTSEWYQLRLLDPAFEIVFGPRQNLIIPDDFNALRALFENTEPGAGRRLARFMEQAQFKYERAMADIIYSPGISFTELLRPPVMRAAAGFQLFSTIRRQVRKNFSHPHLTALMEFPVLFLGASAANTPALYTLMNYAGLRLGTWYPQGGFGAVAGGIARLAEQKGARIHYTSEVNSILITNGRVSGVQTHNGAFPCDGLVAAGDYRHTEQTLLPEPYRNYKTTWWDKKTFAPSCLVFYLGLRKQFPLLHHTLFFNGDLEEHVSEIYKSPVWPANPNFYVCRTSASDPTAAPPGHDNLFLLMPIAPGLPDTPGTREKYFLIMADRIQSKLGEDIRPHIDYQRSYCISDFTKDYGAFKGNAYGLANTLRQTAFLKPKIHNRKLPNLVYAGQLTVPGPGVPPPSSPERSPPQRWRNISTFGFRKHRG
ncbi:phytoene desaturase family protein [Puia sp. P3]|uniref:phytoene desaturase family protein n=1 Tax=Puia sp. P3 TaxID=3423952 RepID=UPI003D67CA86